ncbi:methyltransferase domain-containing protein [Fulvimarina endophytica]|uniref:Methyltransferase domain-containing protein n=1 Tax=Fulvimarina endophytica TaxID=2293836 RepID=A0A371X6Z4_9HYPH|nr:methyltransferase [Fulvimarina endophytica]RFC64961.1 methyltransferase domain-containing protein [Fulvimarina endophytica]
MDETRPTFAVRWRSLRNRILLAPRFHRIALASPVGRFFARRSARKLFDLTAGFVYSQVLVAGVRSKLFEHLVEGPATVSEIAAATGLPEDAARRLLAASASLDLTDRLADGRFMLGAQGAALLANPGVAAMIRHHDALYADLRDPVAALERRGGGDLARLWNYDGDTGEPSAETASYTALMAASQDLVARETLRLFDVRPFSAIVDIGGGNGRFLTHVADRNAHAELHLLDRPSVLPLARDALSHRPDKERFTLHGGHFLTAPLPENCDLVTLIRVLHDHDEEVVERLLRRVYETLEPRRGTLLVSEPMAGARARSRIGDAYFNLYLQAMGSGRPRMASELCDMLRQAGFRRVRALPSGMPIATSAIVAEIG